jgi:Protein of unknown function (DUF4240)
MTETEFWSLIESVRQSATTATETPKRLIDRLKEMPVQDIVEFGRLFRDASRTAYDERLWAAAYAINGGCSDDSFHDFRDWLVTQGKEFYSHALADPDSLAEIELPPADEIFGVGFDAGGVASKAYEVKTGLKDFSKQLGLLPPPALKNQGIWGEDDSSFKQVVPRLYAKFGSKGYP